MIKKNPILSKVANEESSKKLKEALEEARRKKDHLVFVFDIDSSLLCMKYRTQAILKDIAKDPEFKKNFSLESGILEKAKVTERTWSVSEVLEPYGISPDHPCMDFIIKAWRKAFFSNDYLHLDEPYEGSQKYLLELEKTGVEIYYLTARREDKMIEGTLKSLKAKSFPLKTKEHLIMKKYEEKSLSDEDYKVTYLKDFEKKFSKVLFFENEPLILNKTNELLPNVELFWVDSTHSRKANPPSQAHRIDMSWEF